MDYSKVHWTQLPCVGPGGTDVRKMFAATPRWDAIAYGKRSEHVTRAARELHAIGRAALVVRKMQPVGIWSANPEFEISAALDLGLLSWPKTDIDKFYSLGCTKKYLEANMQPDIEVAFGCIQYGITGLFAIVVAEPCVFDTHWQLFRGPFTKQECRYFLIKHYQMSSRTTGSLMGLTALQ